MDQQKIESEIQTKTFFLANNVIDKFATAKNNRTLQEETWIEAMQNFNGEYGSNITFRPGGSSVFVNITQMKTMAAFSRIMAIMMGAGGYPWNIRPTPHPALVKAGVTAEAALVAPEISEEFKAALADAKSKCDGMQNRIKDNLVESHWEEKFSRGVLDLVSLGTMVIKGPVASIRMPKNWVLVEEPKTLTEKLRSYLGLGNIPGARYELNVDPEDAYRATLEWLSPFEFYVDPGAYHIGDAMWAIQRHVFNKAQVVELAGGAGFDAEEITTALDQNPDGNWHSEPWESYMDIINRRTQAAYLSKRYTVLEFWGYLSGKELRDAGATIADKDVHTMHLANIWVLGNYCIKISISGNQAAKIPYFVIPYEKVPYKIWGRGVPEKMRDPQAIINASARAMAENMGMCAGPQVVYDVNRIMPGTKVDEITPWAIWATKSMEGINSDAVKFIKIDPILNELKIIMDIFRNFVQEVTSMPDMSSGFAGNGQHNRTMGGMSMLFGAADEYTRSVIFNIDNDLTKPMIRAMYDWEMQYCPDMSIKGDMQVDASGVQGLMSKELTSTRLSELLQAVGQIPGGADYINMPELLKDTFRALEMQNDSVILSEQEVQKKRAEAQQQQQQQVAAEAQANNLPKPKAETTRNDAILQILEKTMPTDPIYAVMYAKLLDGYNELDPMSEAALNMMKQRCMIENKAIMTQAELSVMQQDIEMESKISQQQQGNLGEAGKATEPEAPPEPPAPPVAVHLHMPGKEAPKGKMKINRDEKGRVTSLEPEAPPTPDGINVNLPEGVK